MNKPLLTIVAIIALLLCPSLSFAFPGEIFEISATGKGYCGDFDAGPTAITLFARLDNETQITLSLAANFPPDLTFPVIGFFYQVNATTASFVGGQLFEGFGYLTIQGLATFDRRTGLVKKLAGTFIESEAFFFDCFSAGKFSSVRRLN